MARKSEIPIGVIFSTTGPYRTVGEEMLNGALLATEEVNSNPDNDFIFTPRVENPGGDIEQYRTICEDMVKSKRISHVVGCYTSISRKEVIPIIEKYDALLWYPSHYEGFESSNNVIYTGASPNQHIVPLVAYALRNYEPRVYCVGSNYIWAWENNRIMREIINDFGGLVISEKYLPVGSVEFGNVISEISDTRPSFIFNTLIGESSYAFYRAYHKAGESNDLFNPSLMPITSCTLSEPELLSIGAPASVGHITSSVYFQSIKRNQNYSFVSRYKNRFGQSRVTSADAEASYIAVMMLAMAVKRSGSTEIEEIKKALYECELEAPQGSVLIDQENLHCYLTPRLGRSMGNGQFSIIATASKPVKPDPYLVWFDTEQLTTQAICTNQKKVYQEKPDIQKRHLRVVK